MASLPESGQTWPALTHESVAWDAHPLTGAPRRDLAMLGRPYRASIPARIADLAPAPTAGAQGLAEEAAVFLDAYVRLAGRRRRMA